MTNQKGLVHLLLLLIIVALLVIVSMVIVTQGIVKIPILQKLTPPQTQSDQPTVNLREAYQNPFETSSEYQNPFEGLK